MQINRKNYEELFLLYVDNELTQGQRSEVEAFVHENPDLADELDKLQQAVMLPDNALQFHDKEHLFKKEDGINIANCEEYFLLYVDNELDVESKKAVETFVLQHPQTQQAFTLLQSTKLEPEVISYNDKAGLYRNEKEKVIPIYWMRIAVAAAVLGIVALLYSVSPNNTTSVTSKEPIALQPSKTAPSSTVEKGENVKVKEVPGEFQKPAVVVKKQSAETESVEVKRQVKSIVTKSNTPELVAVSPRNISPAKKLDILPERSGEEGLAALSLTTQKVNTKEVRIDTRTQHPNEAIENIKPVSISLINSNKDTDDFRQAVYREADTFNEEENSFLIGSARINKNKLRGLLKKATGFLDKRIDRDEDNK